MAAPYFEWLRAKFRAFGDNELSLEDTPYDGGDPPKFRLATRMGQALGCISWNRLRSDDNHEEKVLGIGKATGPQGTGGMLDWFCQDPNVPGDAGMRRIMEWFHDRINFLVPVTIPAQRVTRFYTDHGKFCINWQDDTGRATGVVYDTQNGSTDESTWRAVGLVRIDPV